MVNNSWMDFEYFLRSGKWQMWTLLFNNLNIVEYTEFKNVSRQYCARWYTYRFFFSEFTKILGIRGFFQDQGNDKCVHYCSIISVLLNTQSLKMCPYSTVLSDIPMNFFSEFTKILGFRGFFQDQGNDKCRLYCSIISVLLNTQSLKMCPDSTVLGDIPIIFFWIYKNPWISRIFFFKIKEMTNVDIIVQ